jgi:chorismate mutase
LGGPYVSATKLTIEENVKCFLDDKGGYPMSGNKVNEKKEKIEMLMIRGIRGAIEVKRNERDSILAAARCLLKNILSENQLEPEDIVSIIFTTTKDINAEFPAAVLRDIGWKYIPALCTHEMDVPGGMKGVIRILVHAYVNKNQKDIKHQYLDKTIRLRPDL